MLKDGKLALHTRDMITNAFTSFFDSRSTWIEDYRNMFNMIL